MLLEQAILDYVNLNKSARQVAKEYGLSKDKVTNELNRRGLMRAKPNNSYNKSYFKVIDTEAKAYWLGFIYADGCVKSGGLDVLEIGLSIKDVKHLYKFKHDIEFFGEIKEKCVGKYQSCRLRLFGKEIIEDLINQGAYPRKSLVLEFPKLVPQHLLRHFVRGYFDGDGSVYVSNDKLSISFLGTDNFLNDLQSLFISELSLTKVKIYKHANITEYKKSRKDAMTILNYMYKDCTIYLDRKFNKYAHLTQNLREC